MKIPLFQVDAFTSRVFGGNPAAVCPLERWLEDEVLQSIAAENNLAETAFFIPGPDNVYRLRWFTPTIEVDLCGHATLASAFVLMNQIEPERGEVRFQTLSGELKVTREDDLYTLDFPSRPPAPCEPHPALIEALGTEPQEVWAARDYMVVYENEDEVLGVRPDMAKLATVDKFAVIITAPGLTSDFVSRFFAPAKGIPEDPVTGSSHCTLIPYWSDFLGKDTLHARQLSRRGGELFCQDKGDRVKISGSAALYLEGIIEI